VCVCGGVSETVVNILFVLRGEGRHEYECYSGERVFSQLHL
jgi:hypothetical protein